MIRHLNASLMSGLSPKESTQLVRNGAVLELVRVLWTSLPTQTLILVAGVRSRFMRSLPRQADSALGEFSRSRISR